MEKVDMLDKQILEIISSNARIPFKDVAAECGVSRAAIHQRVQRLVDMKVIIGSGYHVNPSSLGYATCTFVGIKLERGAMYRSVCEAFKAIPEIVECHFTTGPYTMLIKLYARDNAHLMDLLNAHYPTAMTERYKVEPDPDAQGWELLERAARKRGFLISGGEVDLERMGNVLLDEFRAGKLGRVTLEWPED